ncbi:hypothetical protein [Nocardioides sp.]|uniref:hypothetical protein n=1 Tax=Nocardioides sp. TaxID=35761 RepID=UPI0037845F1B
MSQTETSLLLAIVGGFALLAATVGAFVVSRQRLGVLLLVLSGAAFACALVFMARFSSEWEEQQRAEVIAKYDVTVQDWGAPLGSSPDWKVDGRIQDCVVLVTGPDTPTMECGGEEMPLR